MQSIDNSQSGKSYLEANPITLDKKDDLKKLDVAKKHVFQNFKPHEQNYCKKLHSIEVTLETLPEKEWNKVILETALTALGLVVIVGGAILASAFIVKAIHYSFFKVFPAHAKSPSLSKVFYAFGALTFSTVTCLGIAFEYQVGAMRSCYQTAQRAANLCEKAYFEWRLGDKKLQLYHQLKILKNNTFHRGLN